MDGGAASSKKPRAKSKTRRHEVTKDFTKDYLEWGIEVPDQHRIDCLAFRKTFVSVFVVATFFIEPKENSRTRVFEDPWGLRHEQLMAILFRRNRYG